jgi:hypothetical protein
LAPAGEGVCAADGRKPAAAKTANSVSVVLNHVVIMYLCKNDRSDRAKHFGACGQI